MSKKLSVVQVAGPTILVSLLLFGACTFAAVVLYRWHARTAEHLTEDIESRRLSGEIDNNLRTLVKYVSEGSNEDLSSLHKLIEQRLEERAALLVVVDHQHRDRIRHEGAPSGRRARKRAAPDSSGAPSRSAGARPSTERLSTEDAPCLRHDADAVEWTGGNFCPTRTRRRATPAHGRCTR